MGFYSLNLDRLAEHTGKPVEELKNESYAALEEMIRAMEHDIFVDTVNKNAKDEEYERLVLKYFRPVGFLRNFFTDKQIVLACAHTGVTVGDICGEQLVSPGKKCFYANAEYLRTSQESVPQYDARGRELMERERKTMDVYRVAAQYQNLHHGKVIMNLLCNRYPALREYGFKAYSMDYDRDYEIYPENGVYTSLAAMLSGDVDWIIHRNREYCKLYNNGRYSPEKCEEAFKSQDVFEMFDLIRRIGESEANLHHNILKMDDKGTLRMLNGLVKRAESASGNMFVMGEEEERVAKKDAYRFKLQPAVPYKLAYPVPTVEDILDEFLPMYPNHTVNIHIADTEDYLRAHEFDITCMPINVHNSAEGRMKHPMELLRESSYARLYGCPVKNNFGTIKGNTINLVIRVDCKDLYR